MPARPKVKCLRLDYNVNKTLVYTKKVPDLQMQQPNL